MFLDEFSMVFWLVSYGLVLKYISTPFEQNSPNINCKSFFLVYTMWSRYFFDCIKHYVYTFEE